MPPIVKRRTGRSSQGSQPSCIGWRSDSQYIQKAASVDSSSKSFDPTDWYCCTRHKPTYRGAIHEYAFFASPIWSVAMCRQCNTREELAAAALSLLAASFLFWASSRYHRRKWTLHQENVAAQVDFIAISGMIAYSLSPVYVLLLEDGWMLLAGLTVLAVVGAGLTLAEASRSLRTMVCIAQGAFSSIPVLLVDLTDFECICLAVAGFSYVSGSAVYGFKTPPLLVDHFGYHELWHLMIVIAAAGTYSANLSVLSRVQLLGIAA